MSTKKVIELLAESDESWEAAAQKAVTDASESLRGIASIYVKEIRGEGRERPHHALPDQWQGNLRSGRDLTVLLPGPDLMSTGPDLVAPT